MKTFDWLAGMLALSLLAACGDDDDGANDDNTDVDAAITLPVDGAPVPDARPVIDAAPPIDARLPDLSCADDPPPTGEVAAEVRLNGKVQEVFLQGMNPMLRPAMDVAVVAHGRGDDGSLADGTSDSLGEYGLVVASGGNPVDAYLALKKASYIDTYLFAPDPLRADGAVPDTYLLPTLLLQFAPQLGIDLQPGEGMAAVRIVDCEGVGIPGVQPTVSNADPDTQVFDGSLFLPGTFLIFNIPVEQDKSGPLPTAVTIGAEYNGTALQENPIKVFPDSVSFTEVHP